ncbi:MAG: CDP-glycerol glycerophosphotransferase family protein [Gaiellaceae bacterium]
MHDYRSRATTPRRMNVPDDDKRTETKAPVSGGRPRRTGATMTVIHGASALGVLRNTLGTLARAPRFVISFFARRDRKVWVFGNVHGFRDSPRYMAEHVLHNEADIKAFWIAHDPDTAMRAKAAGLKVAMAGSPEARRIHHRARVAFFTHGFRDLELPLLSRAYLVYLWHGTPLKRIGLDVSAPGPRRQAIRLRGAARVVHWFQRRAYGRVRLFVAAGELDRERFITAFDAPRQRVKPLGSPRFDVIRGADAYRRVAPGDLRAELGYLPHERLIVWLPTHRREYGDTTWLPVLSSSGLEASLGVDSDVRILVKTHPNAEWEVFRERLPDDSRIRLLQETEVDVNALLHIADGLISDYSSVLFDYAVLRRPIYFFAPDVERYDSNRGLYDPYAVVTGGRNHTDWPSLLHALANDSLLPDGEGLANWQKIADYTRNNTEPEACRRIADAIRRATDA